MKREMESPSRVEILTGRYHSFFASLTSGRVYVKYMRVYEASVW